MTVQGSFPNPLLDMSGRFPSTSGILFNHTPRTGSGTDGSARSAASFSETLVGNLTTNKSDKTVRGV